MCLRLKELHGVLIKSTDSGATVLGSNPSLYSRVVSDKFLNVSGLHLFIFQDERKQLERIRNSGKKKVYKREKKIKKSWGKLLFEENLETLVTFSVLTCTHYICDLICLCS